MVSHLDKEFPKARSKNSVGGFYQTDDGHPYLFLLGKEIPMFERGR